MKIINKVLSVVLAIIMVISLNVFPVSAAVSIPFNTTNVRIVDVAQGIIEVSGQIMNDPDPILVNRYVTVFVLPFGYSPAEYMETVALATTTAEVDGSFSATFAFSGVGNFSFYVAYEDYTSARADLEIKGIASAAEVVKNINNGTIPKGSIAAAIATHGQMGIDLTRFPVGFARELFVYRMDKNRADIDVTGTDVQILESFYALVDKIEKEIEFVKKFNNTMYPAECIALMRENTDYMKGISFDEYDKLGDKGKIYVQNSFVGKTYNNADEIKEDFDASVAEAIHDEGSPGTGDGGDDLHDDFTKCGENLTSAFYSKSGCIIISGVGEMYDYSLGIAPWFEQRKGVKKVAVKNDVTTIGKYAFADCYNLNSVEVPYSVTSIGDSAFDGCDNLTDVYYKGSEEDWRKITIGANNEALVNATIHYVPYTITSVYAGGKVFFVKARNIEEGTSIILATYNDNKMVEIKACVYESEDVVFEVAEAYTSVEVYAWSSGKPVCEAEIVI